MRGQSDRWFGRATEALVVSAFFVTVALIGLAVLPTYGVTFDEEAHRTTGKVSLFYAAETMGIEGLGDRPVDVPAIDEYADRDYGVAFDLPAEILVSVLGITDDRDAFLLKHLMTFMSFLTCAFVLYLAVRKRHNNWLAGLLAAASLVLSPRIWADAFYNPVDIVFMAAFALAAYCAVEFGLRPTLGVSIAAGACLGLAVNVRVMALWIPLMLLALLVFKVWSGEVRSRKAVGYATIYVAAAACLAFAFWPWLWADPIRNLAESFSSASKIRWSGVNRYMGELIDMNNAPWHYIPVWISITTPLAYVASTVAGVADVARRTIRRQLSDDTIRDLWFLAMWVGPIAAVVLLNATIYDGWRHMFFIYPAMIYTAVCGVMSAWRALERVAVARWILVGLLALSMGWTGWWMVDNHPYSNVYFNVVAGDNWRDRWWLDYWGVSYREAFEFILADSQASQVGIWAVSSTPARLGEKMLDPALQERAVAVESQSDATYVIDNYCNAFSDSRFADFDYSAFELVRTIDVGDEPICSIYRRVR